MVNKVLIFIAVITQITFTNIVNAAINPPDNITVNQINSNQAKISWPSVTGAVKYNIYINNHYKTTVNHATDYIAKGLSADAYEVKITSINQYGEISRYSQSLNFNINNSSNSAPSSLVDSASPRNSKPGYTLTFSDEFNQYSLNNSKWNTKKMWGPDIIINNEKQYYIDVQGGSDQQAIGYNPFKFNGSNLTIEASKTPNDKKWMVHNQPYISGVLTTYKKFSAKYGYFEARVKIPAQNGTFPAFWLLHDRQRDESTQRTEIDIFESLGHRPDIIHNTVHYYHGVTPEYEGNHVQKSRPQVSGQDFSRNYHVYAVKWEPGYVAWYIDGEKVNELYDSNTDYEQMYLIVNLAMGGNWVNKKEWGGLGYNFPNQSDLQNKSNAKLQIDYIRAYTKN